VAQTGLQHWKLQHQSLLHLGLQQLQQLLLWGVLAPACKGQRQLSAAVEALGDMFSAEALGVRERQERSAEVQVQVVGAHIADTLDLVARCQQQQQQQRRMFEEQQVSSVKPAGVTHEGSHGSVQQGSSRDGNVGSGVTLRRSSSCSDAGGVVMPLGLCLGLTELCAVLQKRLG
jgi:hypothetical protein